MRGLSVGWFALGVVNPLRELMTQDDGWAYPRMVAHLLATGEYRLDAWSAANMPAQVYLAAGLSKVFGYSLALLRCTTLALLALALVSLRGLLHEFGVRPTGAAIMTLGLLACPLVLMLSFTFMSDVQFLGWMLLALWGFVRGFRTDSAALVFGASLATAAAIDMRQNAPGTRCRTRPTARRRPSGGSSAAFPIAMHTLRPARSGCGIEATALAEHFALPLFQGRQDRFTLLRLNGTLAKNSDESPFDVTISTARLAGDTPAPRIAVIGAGPMGLAAASELIKKGAQVEVFERDDRLGGMSAHFDFAGTALERYYHFVCGPDQTMFEALREFGLEDKLHWVDTHMGLYYNGTLHDWGTPLAMLRFPGLSFWQKLRYGLHVMRAKGITDWRPYDKLTATEWVTRWIGAPAYEIMWRKLFRYKFYEREDDLSAAWLGTRIKRVALSRTSIFQERLGYLEGGSLVLLDAMAARIVGAGGRITLSTPIESVRSEGEGAAARVTGLRIGGQDHAFDAVVSTVPLPYVPGLVPGLPAAERAKVEAIANVGVVCVILKLKRPFTRNFWLNINDPRIEIPGLIEYSNLNPLDGSSILYAPFYMPATHPKYGRDTQAFVDETLDGLCAIRPDFDRADVLAATASRYQYAQTVCTPGFFDALPPMRSALAGFFMADTSYYYPEDRSISESVRVGHQLAAAAWEAQR